MNERPSSPKPSAVDQILDLLLDALLERQAARRAQAKSDATPTLAPDKLTFESPIASPSGPMLSAQPPPPEPTVAPEPEPAIPPTSITGLERPALKPGVEESVTRPEPAPGGPSQMTAPLHGLEPDEEGWTPPPPLPSINLGRTLRRLLIGLTVIVALVNIPLNAAGVSLSRALPDVTSLVIRDGLVLKGSGPEIYVLENNRLRWISSLEAFEFFGYRWEQVHIVEDSFLSQFQQGRPKHVLLKCERSPHIYALEIDKKRWIKDIPTLEAEGFVWEDVKFVSCDYLRSLPDGLPIPADAGPPPQP